MIKALIFDFDGTLVDSMNLHFKCYRDTLLSLGIHINQNEYHELSGKSGREVLDTIRYRYKVDFDIEQIYDEKKRLFMKNIHRLSVYPRMRRILRCNFGRYKMAVVSVSSSEIIESVLSENSLCRYFDEILGFETLGMDKTSPHIYLEASRKMNIIPQHCLVLEDSVAAINSAHNAGMHVVPVKNGVILEPIKKALHSILCR